MSAQFYPSPALAAFTASIVDSPEVLSVFASAEWGELNDDGQIWLCAIVKAALDRAGVALVPIVSMPLVDRPRLARANDNGGAL